MSWHAGKSGQLKAVVAEVVALTHRARHLVRSEQLEHINATNSAAVREKLQGGRASEEASSSSRAPLPQAPSDAGAPPSSRPPASERAPNPDRKAPSPKSDERQLFNQKALLP